MHLVLKSIKLNPDGAQTIIDRTEPANKTDLQTILDIIYYLTVSTLDIDFYLLFLESSLTKI